MFFYSLLGVQLRKLIHIYFAFIPTIAMVANMSITETSEMIPHLNAAVTPGIVYITCSWLLVLAA